jgi:hypothetical protein
VYRALVVQHTAALGVGEQTVDTVGRVSVTVQRVTPWAYSVVTEQGTYRAEQWCRSYPTQAEADAARTHALAAFARYGTIDAVEARTAELIPEWMRLTGRRGPTARRDEKAASVELYGLATLAEKAQLADIADELETFRNAA